MADEKLNKAQQRLKLAEEATKGTGINPADTVRPEGFSGLGQGYGVYTPQSGVLIGGTEAPGERGKEYRVGDYKYSPTTKSWNVVENSPTDIINKYIVSDADSKKNFSVTDWFSVLGAGLKAGLGLPTDSSNIAGTVVTGATSQLMKKNPISRALWAAGNALNEANNISQKYADEYLNQDFNYSLGGEFSTDKDGSIKFTPKYTKNMLTATSESGSAVMAAQNTDNTKVEMPGDGKIKVTVSPLFAKSNKYKEILKTIDENVPYLTKEEANKVYDEDSGMTRLQAIESYIKDTENQFYYKARASKVIKEEAPSASDEVVSQGVETSKIGYYKDKTLESTKVYIYNEKNEKVEVNAKEYLDSIKSKDKLERQNYMSSLGARIADPNVSDDERAILYAQTLALYNASNNDGSYKGMYTKDLFDSIGDVPGLFSGIRLGDFVGAKPLDTFQTDELHAGLLNLANIGASAYTLSKVTNGIEKGLRKITPKLSTWAGESTKEAIAAGEKAAEDSSALRGAASTAGRSLTQVGYQVAADAIYDAAKLIPYAATGNMEDYDFLSELSTDFLIDMLVTYGPGAYAEGMKGSKMEYKVLVQNGKGATKYVHPSEIEKGWERVYDERDLRNQELIDKTADELIDARTVSLSKLGEVTSDEKAMRWASRFDKVTDSKWALKTQELFFDRNAAMAKMAVQVRKVAGGDSYEYRKMLRASLPIKQLTADMRAEYFLTNKEHKSHYEELQAKIKEYMPRARNFTKEDANYINAMANRDRFTKMAKGDKQAIKQIKAIYDPYIKAMDAERAEQLNDLMASMRLVASDVLDFYVQKGLLTQAQVDKMRALPQYAGGMYMPIWSERVDKNRSVLSQSRAEMKKIFDPSQLIDVKDLENPLVSLAGYLNNAFQNAALNYRAEVIREIGSIPGMKLHVYKDTGGSLKDVKNLTELNEKFKKKYDKIVAEVEKEYPTHEEWADANSKTVLRSKGMKIAQKIEELQQNLVKLREEQRAASKKKAPALAPDAVLSLMDRQQVSNAMRSQGVKSGSVAKNLFTQVGKARSNSKEAKKKYESWKIRLDEKTDKWLDAKIKKYGGGKTGYAGFLAARKALGEKFDDDIDRTYLKNSPEFTKSKEFAAFSAFKASEDAFFERQRMSQEVEANKQEQLILIDQLKEAIANTMKRVARGSKSEAKLDIDNYVDTTLTNQLKKALRGGVDVGKIQEAMNAAIDAANPYVDRDIVIMRMAEDAAEKFRKSLNKNMAIDAAKSKDAADYVNAMADKVMDYIMKKGKTRNRVTVIGDDRLTRILNNYGDPHTIRYMMDGVEQRMVLTGKGSEAVVNEFYAPEATFKTGIRGVLGRGAAKIANAKRYLTTSVDPSRVMPNLVRDWTRGIVSTGGQILLSPEKLKNEMLEQMRERGWSEKEIEIVNNGWKLAREAVDRSSFNASMVVPRKNRAKAMVQAMNEPDGNAFIRFTYYMKTGQLGKVAQMPQDLAEGFTRKRAMDVAYYQEMTRCISSGMSVDDAVRRATEAAYFYGRESTTNFSRRGVLIEKIAQNVPYLSQKFGTLESMKYSFLDDPIAVTRSLEATVSAYTALIAIALASDESRKKYYLLTEYDRANNVIIPIDSGMIVTIPLDDTIAAFLTPYRRMVETLNGVDPEAFYMCFAEGLEALSPADLSGFSEGDKFNVKRGLEKLASEFLPTWAHPIVENIIGEDLYYGSSIRVTDEDVLMRTDEYPEGAGQLTTKSKNSRTLSFLSNMTGWPQWQVQNMLEEYGGNLGQVALNVLDKLEGATGEEQGGKEWLDSVFKPFTGSDSKEVTSRFWDAINQLKDEKQKLIKEITNIEKQVKAATGNTKAELQQKRQDKISAYGERVTDLLNQYLSAYEITGGLPENLAGQVFWLYKLYDVDEMPAGEGSAAEYYRSLENSDYYKRAAALAAKSGASTLMGDSPISEYYETYGEQALQNALYGQGDKYLANINSALKSADINRSNMFKGWDKMSSSQKKAWKKNWNTKVSKALKSYVDEVGIDSLLNSRKVVDALDEVIFVSNPWKTKDYLKEIFK